MGAFRPSFFGVKWPLSNAAVRQYVSQSHEGQIRPNHGLIKVPL
jgi:hypothetical protein